MPTDMDHETRYGNLEPAHFVPGRESDIDTDIVLNTISEIKAEDAIVFKITEVF